MNVKITHRQAQKRSMIKTEDGLTYNVFNRLSYLEIETLSEILLDAFDLRDDDINLKTIEHINFWPKWNSQEMNINNTTYIEPDVFISLLDADIIIEAKRYDLRQQSESQWKDQIIAYKHCHGERSKKLLYVPLGGMSFSKVEYPSVIIKQSYWFQLAQACKNAFLKAELRNVERRIITDVLEILKYYDHKPLSFLGSLKSINLSKYSNPFNT